MKRLGKILAYGVLAVILLLPVAITFTIGWRPFIGPKTRELTNRTFERTPERLARGTYLVEAQMGCMVCRSPHDWTKHDPVILTGMKGAGQDFSLLKGLPGRVIAPTSRPTRRRAPAIGAMTLWRAPYAKASDTMAALYFP